VTLPSAVASWRAKLAVFDPAVAAALTPMLSRLYRVIGALAGEGARGLGEVAGYDGVAARGPYERLVATEWLLADEAPDEFMRRAATNELLFLALARESPRLARHSTVLVDAGPEVFGAPRLAVFAALVVLEARARAARADFEWRFAQGGDDTKDADVATALRMRADGNPSEEDLGARIEAALARGEAWVVGGSEATRIASARGASTVRVDDVLEPDARALAITVSAGRGPDRTALLELPDDATCVRILRDPYPTRSHPRASTKGAARAPFALALPAISGGRIFARLENGSVLALPVPNSPRFSAGDGRVLHAHGAGEIIAVGRQ